MGSENSNEASEFTLTRKAATIVYISSYRKPTQVDDERIIRLAG